MCYSVKKNSMKKIKLITLYLVFLFSISCTYYSSDNGEFTITEHSENDESDQKIYERNSVYKSGFKYSFSIRNSSKSSVKINDVNIIKKGHTLIVYNKLPLNELLDKLGYNTYKNKLDKNPLLSIYYDQDSRTKEEAELEIVKILSKTYKLNTSKKTTVNL